MLSSLSKMQLEISNYRDGAVVVKACPGSGKTYSVAARLASLLSKEKFLRKGILGLSYTNVAIDEIKYQLRNKFDISTSYGFPHYLGTIDSFVNNYIFLPFGHLIMECPGRPKLVGGPHSTWTFGKGDRTYAYPGGVRRCVSANPDGYFDCTTFDINDKLIPIVSPREFHFSFSGSNYFKNDGSPIKRVQDIIDSKFKLFKYGYANQSDANYIALKVLIEYPIVLDNVANQFKYLLIDEAQDTDQIQMRIIEQLFEKGLKNIMLIGDRDQAIFEWNSARPELFDEKYDLWEKIELTENRRSSQKICDFTIHLSSFDRTKAINENVSHFEFEPEILDYLPESKAKNSPISFNESKSSFDEVMRYYIAICEQNRIDINKENVAVLYRGRSYARYLGLQQDIVEFGQLPWVKGSYHVKDVIQGKHLMDVGDFSNGYKLLERGLINAKNRVLDAAFFCNQDFIQSLIDRNGLRSIRNEIHSIINSLPSTRSKTIRSWVQESNDILNAMELNFDFPINVRNGDVLVDDFFASDLNLKEIHPFFYGTIHSAKGKTFEAVLLILSKKPGNKSNYSTMLRSGCKPGEEEELRNIYVAITRPRKVLLMVVPTSDLAVWKSKFSKT